MPGENSWYSSKPIREAKIAKFKADLHQKLGVLVNGANGSEGHSIIYRSLARYLALLVSRPAKYKALIVYSDLLENDEISFYDPNIFNKLKKRPLDIQKQLEREMPLSDLITINVFMVYDPQSYYDNNRFMTCSEFFGKLFRSKHAWVHTEPSF